MSVPRVEALCTSTLGYKIATPTELPGVRTINDGLTISIAQRGHMPTFPKGKCHGRGLFHPRSD